LISRNLLFWTNLGHKYIFNIDEVVHALKIFNQ